MELIRQPPVLTLRRCQPRLFSQSRTTVTCLLGSKFPAKRQPPPQPSPKRLGEQILLLAAGGVVSVSITYLANVYNLPNEIKLINQRLDQQSKVLEQQSVNLDKALEKQSMNLEKVLSESVDYRREVAELRGGFQVILQKRLS
ncbi:hypothetical protein WJX74_000727 [Apatococcus lobatus]|uniref:Uncharacterized protein n=1 Tax=Apatococcus lobatus TaxID=904363 RepID=A0AAW1QWP9_9CHLO